ncbi:DNA-directed DNA polymerase [Besnoitia besnoiti]|uniref:DNA-directed DNA polymerase n=1 Tax=Besnoitia besnoiti TaxID=94643 RepID=A0A2A9MF03_BESBE|nr:DNA-directed DNA polymerase [Besnoitia besnoiti]PFH34841.1 DNA-directed DNA polymerase [Besnoitia besnoiti]
MIVPGVYVDECRGKRHKILFCSLGVGCCSVIGLAVVSSIFWRPLPFVVAPVLVSLLVLACGTMAPVTKDLAQIGRKTKKKKKAKQAKKVVVASESKLLKERGRPGPPRKRAPRENGVPADSSVGLSLPSQTSSSQSASAEASDDTPSSSAPSTPLSSSLSRSDASVPSSRAAAQGPPRPGRGAAAPRTPPPASSSSRRSIPSASPRRRPRGTAAAACVSARAPSSQSPSSSSAPSLLFPYASSAPSPAAPSSPRAPAAPGAACREGVSAPAHKQDDPKGAGGEETEWLGSDAYFVAEDEEKNQRQLETNTKIRGLLTSFRSSVGARGAEALPGATQPLGSFLDDFSPLEAHSESTAETMAASPDSPSMASSFSPSPFTTFSLACPALPRALGVDTLRRGRDEEASDEETDGREVKRKKSAAEEHAAAPAESDQGDAAAAAAAVPDSVGEETGTLEPPKTYAETAAEGGGRLHGPPWTRNDLGNRDHLDFFHRLHEECLDFIHWIDATEDEERKRAKVLARITALARLLWDDCVVCPFGSYYTSLCLPHADLDVCIFINSKPPLLEEFHELGAIDTTRNNFMSSCPSESSFSTLPSYKRLAYLTEKVMAEAATCQETCGQHASFRKKKEESAQCLRRLATLLSSCRITLPSADAGASLGAGCAESLAAPLIRDLQLILEARVPICRFVDSETGINVDVSIDQQSAVLTSLYVRLQLLRFPLLRPLMLLNKATLKHWRLNEPFTGGVGSYLLFVMALSFLQLNPRLYDRRAHQRYSLGHALFEFLHHYGVDFRYPSVGLSVRNKGRLFPKDRRRWRYGPEHGEGGPEYYYSTEQDRFLLAAESPLEPFRDIGRGAFQMPQIRSAWRSVYARMASRLRAETRPCRYRVVRSSDSLLSYLIPPEPFRLLPPRPPLDAAKCHKDYFRPPRRRLEEDDEAPDEAPEDGERPTGACSSSFSSLPPHVTLFRRVCGLRAVTTEPSKAAVAKEQRLFEACFLSSGGRKQSGAERNRRGLKLLKKKIHQLEKEQRLGGRGLSPFPRQNSHFFFEADSEAEREAEEEDDEEEDDKEQDEAAEKAETRLSSKLSAPIFVNLLSASSSDEDDAHVAATGLGGKGVKTNSTMPSSSPSASLSTPPSSPPMSWASSPEHSRDGLAPSARLPPAQRHSITSDDDDAPIVLSSAASSRAASPAKARQAGGGGAVGMCVDDDEASSSDREDAEAGERAGSVPSYRDVLLQKATKIDAEKSAPAAKLATFDLGGKEAEAAAGDALTYLTQRSACKGKWEEKESDAESE